MKVKHVLMIAAVLLAMLAVPVSADETVVTYTPTERYNLVIPEGMTVGTAGDIGIEGLLQDYSQVTISVSSGNDWQLKLASGKGGLGYALTWTENNNQMSMDADGDLMTVKADEIAGTDNQKMVISATAALKEGVKAKYQGDHTDLLTFTATEVVFTPVDDATNLIDALEKGDDVVLISDVKMEAETTAPYGNKYAVKLDGGILDGNGNELEMECYGDDYGIMTSGGTIKNLEIKEGCRAVMIMYPTEDVILDNVNIGGDGVLYPINTGEAGSDDVELIVTNSVLAGWTSYSNIKSASFTNVEFKQGTYYNNIYGRVLKPYVNTVLTDCSFIEHMNLDLSSLASGQKVTFKDCTVNSQDVTKDVFTIPSTDAEYDSGLFTVDLPDWAESIDDCIVIG